MEEVDQRTDTSSKVKIFFLIDDVSDQSGCVFGSMRSKIALSVGLRIVLSGRPRIALSVTLRIYYI